MTDLEWTEIYTEEGKKIRKPILPEVGERAPYEGVRTGIDVQTEADLNALINNTIISTTSLDIQKVFEELMEKLAGSPFKFFQSYVEYKFAKNLEIIVCKTSAILISSNSKTLSRVYENTVGFPPLRSNDEGRQLRKVPQYKKQKKSVY